MSLLDQVTGALGGGKGGGGVQAVLLQQLISMLSQPGALAKLTDAFQSAGLGSVLESWLGKGQNLPISALQVTQVLGNNTIAEMAKKAGIGAPDAANALSGLLPQVIDKISPGGAAPGAGELGGLLSSVGKLFG
jgi:uncharacterized protein YidB (DUF937 family)